MEFSNGIFGRSVRRPPASSPSSRNVLIILTHRSTDAFIERLKWTTELWKGFHPLNEVIVIVDTTEGVGTRRDLYAAGLNTIGYRKGHVLGEAPASCERENNAGRGFDMVFHYMRRHRYDYYWYLENDVKYDQDALSKMWERHADTSDDLIAWQLGRRGDDWWAYEMSASDWMHDREYVDGCLMMMNRVSSRLSEKINDYMVLGNSAYIEILLPSVAKRHRMSIVEWDSSIIGLLVPGPAVNGENVELLPDDDGDCRRPVEKVGCGERFWHPSVLALRGRCN
jgi:hypothetical protein